MKRLHSANDFARMFRMIPRRTKSNQPNEVVIVHNDQLDEMIKQFGGQKFAWKDRYGRTHVSHIFSPYVPWEDWPHTFKNKIKSWIKANADRPIEVKLPKIKLPTSKAVSMASSKKSIFENTAPSLPFAPIDHTGPEVGSKRKKFAGENINSAHVSVPLKWALIDGLSIASVFSVTYPWLIIFEWVDWMGIGYLSLSIVTVFTISSSAAWWIEKLIVLHQKIKDQWENETEESEPVYPNLSITVTKTDPRTNKDVVTHFDHIAFLIPDGWTYKRFRDACTNIINKGSFSQGSAGLNPKPFKAFRKKFLEYQHEYGCVLIYWKDDTNHNLGMTMSDECKDILRSIADDVEVANWMKSQNL